MSRRKDPEWIPTHKAMEITGSPSTWALCVWLAKWNNNPTTAHKVRRRHGYVEKHSLIAALDEDEARYNKSGQAAQAFINQQAFSAAVKRSDARINNDRKEMDRVHPHPA